MSFFHLVFETDNAAFIESESSEIARILSKTALRIDNGRPEGPVLDANGNTVGNYASSYGHPLYVEEPRELFVIIAGDLAEGFDFIGPFLGSQDAIDYGGEHIGDERTWVHVPLHRGV